MHIKYKYLNHTADIEYIAYGKNNREIFVNALLGMFDIIADLKKIKTIIKIKNEKKFALTKKRIKIKEYSNNLEELLWKVLLDALSFSDAEQLFFYNVKKSKIVKKKNLYYFYASLLGVNKFEKVSKFDVKGVSMFGMKIEKLRDTLHVHVILDV